MPPQKKARLAFISAVTLLLIGGLVAGLTIMRLIDSTKWVAHTYGVKLALSEFSSDLSALGRARTSYLLSSKSEYRDEYEAAKSRIPTELQNLKDLIQDNPGQQRDFVDLQSLIGRRSAILNVSMELQEHGGANDSAQDEYSRQLSTLASGYNAIIRRMQQAEQSLLDQRIQLSDKLFRIVVSLLCVTFALAVALLWMHYRFLTAEASEREKAELKARSSEEASRRLSVRILQLQDEERRKFSRELHDSLGQNLTVAKMIVDALSRQNPLDTSLPQIANILNECLTETRTISHLLHPPLLDELGLASAAKWYVEGFAKRSGVPVTADIPDIPRLSRATELAFFRALQESMTNIHRHSKCTNAHVSFKKTAKDVSLIVKDNGKGVPKEILDRFHSSGAHAGVGLAGMRERIREQGGSFTIQSNATGTTVSVTLPMTAATSDDSAFRSDVLSH